MSSARVTMILSPGQHPVTALRGAGHGPYSLSSDQKAPQARPTTREEEE